MNDSPLQHLTPAEVETVLNYIQEVDAILVGGQSLAIWARLYLERQPRIAAVYSMSSEDVDLFGDEKAARKFAQKLKNSRVYVPEFGDNTPNSAVVVGVLGSRQIKVDFLKGVLGVDSRSLKNNFVTLSGPSPSSGGDISILIMHPLDCLRSRLSNINDLKRTDPHSRSSAEASILILDVFIDDLLQRGETKEAQTALMDLYFVVRDRCLGRLSHTQFGLDPRYILAKFRLDPRLDARWRSHQLASALERLKQKATATDIDNSN